jgi:hypothetical protein
MSAYNPPSANLPIFDSKSFTDENTNEFLEFPTAQGIENFPSGLIGNLSGNATSASTITTNATAQTSQHYINFSDSSSTGTGAVQKVAGLSVFPNGTTYQGNTYAGAALLCPTHIGNTFTSFQSNNLTLSTNGSAQDIKLNTGSNNIATISNTGLAMTAGKTISGGLAGGVAGAIVFQSAVGTTGFTNAGTNGQSLLSAGTGTPIWGTPALATAATSATHLANGGPGQFPYNSSAGNTTFLAAGAVGQTLTSNGTGTPLWGWNIGYIAQPYLLPALTTFTFDTTYFRNMYIATGTSAKTIELPLVSDTSYDGQSIIIVNKGTSTGTVAIYGGAVNASNLITTLAAVSNKGTNGATFVYYYLTGNGGWFMI